MIAALQYFVVGSVDSEFSEEYDANITAFIGRKRAFEMIDTSITDDVVELARLREQISLICAASLTPIIQIDPVVGGGGKDQTEQILEGLMDTTINLFLQNLKKVVPNGVVIVIGGRANERPPFAQSPENFKSTFVKLRKMIIDIGIHAKFAFSISSPVCLANGSVTREEFSSNTNCKYSVPNLYPGDQYVDYVLVYALNERQESETASELVRKAMFAANEATSSKNIILVAGSKSNNSPDYKNDFIQELLEEVSFYTEENEFYDQRIMALILYNVEVNYDTAMYYSLQGDEKVGETNNGQPLYSYRALRQLQNEPEALEWVDEDVLASGALCDPGTFASGGQCVPCPEGYFEANAAQSSCEICTIGSYESQKGQVRCIECQEGRTTLGNGSVLEEECGCPANYEESANGCIKCPQNSYSQIGGECMACNGSSSNAKEGAGCHCKRGFKWSSEELKCVESDSSFSNVFATLGAAILMFGVLL